jgi:hypothetical protein
LTSNWRPSPPSPLLLPHMLSGGAVCCRDRVGPAPGLARQPGLMSCSGAALLPTPGRPAQGRGRQRGAGAGGAAGGRAAPQAPHCCLPA